HGPAPGEETPVLVLVDVVDLDQQRPALPPLLALRPELLHLRELPESKGAEADHHVGERAAERPQARRRRPRGAADHRRRRTVDLPVPAAAGVRDTQEREGARLLPDRPVPPLPVLPQDLIRRSRVLGTRAAG